jgi:hypothetical protein
MRLVRAFSLTWAMGILCGACTVCSDTFRAAAAVPQEPAGYWRGSGWSRRVSDLKYVTLSTDYRTEFWFTLASTGELQGTAMVTYTLSFDDSALRGLITQANKGGNSIFSLAPGMGGLIGSNVNQTDLVGMSMAYDEVMPVRVSSIHGKLAGNQLRIEWGAVPPEIPYKRYVLHTVRRDLQGTHTHPAYSPWTAPAQLKSSGNGHYEVTVLPKDAATKSGDTAITSVWTAYRVGP